MTRSKNLPPTHPGEILREDVLPALTIGKAEFARRLKVSRQTLYAILAGEQPVSTAVALRLDRLVGGGEVWNRLQADYDFLTQAAAMADELAAMERVEQLEDA